MVYAVATLSHRICCEGEAYVMRLRDFAREGLYCLLYAITGSGKGVRVILLYHSVGGKPPYGVSPQRFEEQMSWVKKQFRVVRLCDLPKAVQSEASDANLACITFDDGCRDNFEVALPILDRFGLKATFFIATGFLNGTFRTSTGEEYSAMTPKQVQELAALGHEVGAHTVTHPKLTRLPPTQAYAEIINSKSYLEDLLGSPVTSFAYPKGDYNAAVRSLVVQAGFQVAVTIREGLVGDQPDWLSLPRVWVSGMLGTKGFKARLSPAIDLYRRIVRGA